MARGRRRADRRQSNDNAQRVSNQNATAIRAVLGVDSYFQAPAPALFTEIEDYRQFHPEGALRTPMTVFGAPSSLEVRYAPARSHVGVSMPKAGMPSGRVFRGSSNVLVCVRRKMRREVLFANGRTQGGSRQRRRHRSWRSALRCK